MEYSNLKKLGKDELIYLITMLEKDIKSEYEKYTIPPNAYEFYYKIKKLFKDKNDIVSISNSNQSSMFISNNPDILDLNPITLQTEIDKETLEDAFGYNQTIYPNIKNIDDVLAKNIKQVIAINKTENKAIGESVLFDIKNKRNILVLRMFPDKKEFRLKDLLEIVYRLRREKNINQEEELYRSFKSHIDENGTLFLEVKFDYFTEQRLGEGGDEIETSDEGEDE